MSLSGIFDPEVRAYFNGCGSGADDLIVKMAECQPYVLKSDAVTKIAENAFRYNNYVQEVDFPNVVEVGMDSFASCDNLSEANLPNLKSVTSDCFDGCEKLAVVNVPNAIGIGKRAFRDCTSLSEIDMHNAKFIEDSAFVNCTSLSEINLPEVTTIHESAFDGAGLCGDVYLPKVTFLDKGAFYHTNIRSISVPAMTQIPSDVFVNFLGSDTHPLQYIDAPEALIIHEYALIRTSLASGVFPKATEVGSAAFALCPSLTKLDFHKLSSIGQSAFAGCTALTVLILRNTSGVCAVEDLNVFSDTPMLTGEGHIYVPASMYEHYRAGYESELAEGFFDILFRKIEDYPEICGV